MAVEILLQLLTAAATIMIAFAAFRQLRESAEEKQRGTRLRVLKFLYLYHRRISAAIRMIPQKRFNSWDIESDIKQHYTVEFYSLPKNIQSELRRVSIEYNTLREEQSQQRRKSPEKMKDSLENLKELIEKEIDSLVSKLQLDQL
jgi:hypothetical protein